MNTIVCVEGIIIVGTILLGFEDDELVCKRINKRVVVVVMHMKLLLLVVMDLRILV